MRKARRDGLREEFSKVEEVLASTPSIDPAKVIAPEEFRQRQHRVWQELEMAGFDCGFVFSDEHYNGDVPYLGGNTNITIEQVAGVIGPHGFHIIAGLEGGYVVEQLAPRAGAPVHKVEMLQLAGEDYPIEAETPEEVFELACGRRPNRIALLSPRQVIPVMMVDFMVDHFGPDSVVDAAELYGRIKYEKSDAEIDLTRDATVIADAMMRAMLAVLKPGMLETQVAAWGGFVARELGAEEMGWDVMVTANVANRTLIGKALNRIIQPGDMVHLGAAPKRDGLTSCIRRSAIALHLGESVSAEQEYWLHLIRDAYRVGHEQFITTAREALPAYTIEKAIIDFLSSQSEQVSRRVGHNVDLVAQKPYSCVHNAGYTECQEFYGAVTLNSQQPLGDQVVNMLDVALRGCGSRWEDVVIPGLDFAIVENTFAKRGSQAECLNTVPDIVQPLVGSGLN